MAGSALGSDDTQFDAVIVGPNPSLTIAVLAEQFADGIIDGRGIEAA